MDTSLKQRLIGAVVLVALAVIFLPMLVKGPAPDSEVADVRLDVPAAPAMADAPRHASAVAATGQYETRELPLVVPAASATGMPAALPAGRTTAAESDAALPPTSAAGNYAVNFGAYATEADADAVIAFLKSSNLPGFRQPGQVNGRQAWRVRIGPYADRAQAELVRLQAGQLRSDVNAQVVVLDADNDAAAAATPAPLAGSSTAPAPAPAPRSEPRPVEPARPVVATPAPAPPKPQPPKTEAPKPNPAVPGRTTTTVSTAPAQPAASGVGFAVQLGAFGKQVDANALRDRVRGNGFSAFVEQVNTDNGVLHRVRVGPVASRAEAEQLKAQLAARIGIAGMVRPHP